MNRSSANCNVLWGLLGTRGLRLSNYEFVMCQLITPGHAWHVPFVSSLMCRLLL